MTNEVLNWFYVLSFACHNTSSQHKNLGDGEEQGVCLLFQVAQLDSGVVKRLRKPWARCLGDFLPRVRKGDGLRLL